MVIHILLYCFLAFGLSSQKTEHLPNFYWDHISVLPQNTWLPFFHSLPRIVIFLRYPLHFLPAFLLILALLNLIIDIWRRALWKVRNVLSVLGEEKGVFWHGRLEKCGIFQIVDSLQDGADFGAREQWEGKKVIIMREWVAETQESVFHCLY